MLRHGLEATERRELGLCVEHIFDGFRAECSNQLILEIGDAGEEASRLERLLGCNGASGSRKRATHMGFVGSVVHAAEAPIGMREREVPKYM